MTWVAVRRCMFIVTMVSSVGQDGHVSIVEVDVGGFRRLAIRVVVAVVMVAVVVMVGHRVCSRYASHWLLHIGIMGWRFHLQRSLSSICLVAGGSAMTTIHEMVTEYPAVTLWKNGQIKTNHQGLYFSQPAVQMCY